MKEIKRVKKVAEEKAKILNKCIEDKNKEIVALKASNEVLMKENNMIKKSESEMANKLKILESVAGDVVEPTNHTVTVTESLSNLSICGDCPKSKKKMDSIGKTPS